MRSSARPKTPSPAVGSFEAKTHLSRLLEEVRAGSIVTITVRGLPVAKLVPADAEVRLPARGNLDAWLRRTSELRSRMRSGPESAAALVRAGRRP